MRKQLVVANWKLNGDRSLCEEFAQGLGELFSAQSVARELVVCPPAVFIEELVQGLALQGAPVAVGGQNVAAQASGAFTGEISAAMLKDAGARLAIVGHSERRALFAESDQVVAQKAREVLVQGLVPIVCVGEELSVREAGDHLEFVGRQVEAAIGQLAGADLVIAYEPVWAIGTGNTATPEQVQEMHAHIRGVAGTFVSAETTRILYGGSVNPGNAAELLALPDVDGALVGGASLVLDKFIAIGCS